MDGRRATRPHVVVLGGPNGAGTSTVAPRLLRDTLGVTTFVNADDIARGLSGFAPEAVAIRAGRLMLDRLAELTRERATFAFESTLAGLGMRAVLARCRDTGYVAHVVYFWLPSPEFALARVRQRVAAGGHDVPKQDVRRRWARSLGQLSGSLRSAVGRVARVRRHCAAPGVGRGTQRRGATSRRT